ncbi:hypothetical protein J2S74_002347 [Evansella vedderi]|uniref:DUF7852 domain-containing protein n=1 Tax=Evansella vedderi TaxID=38282 RepID=A0ABT9ZXV6_9BACI|nr:SPOCS domain-containing protein [Evansella vedderi]MDQ0254965.1 hypothetical protein [Evansella vedderi]
MHGKNKRKPTYKIKQKNAILPLSKNTPQRPKVIKDAFVKVPVVLAETKVQLDMIANIEFPEPVLEIKDIKKNIKVTQCRLLLPTNKLFIAGFVRKNIQYATPKYSGKDFVSSGINSLTVDVPFETVTEVDFINKPQLDFTPKDEQFTYYKESKLPKGFSDKEKLLSGDFAQFNKISGEKFNQLPYCELLSSQFIEYDEYLNRKMGEVFDKDGNKMDAPFEEGTFTKMEEKMVVELTLKVLQEQQVKIEEIDKKNW